MCTLQNMNVNVPVVSLTYLCTVAKKIRNYFQNTSILDFCNIHGYSFVNFREILQILSVIANKPFSNLNSGR